MKAERPFAAIYAVVGGKVALGFGAVTFVLVFLIAALQVASRHALKEYVDDQLARLPWDVSVYQGADFESAPAMRAAIASVAMVDRVEDIHFLRAMVPATTVAYVDAEPLRSPWLSLLSATAAALLPPEVRPRGDGAVLVLVGSQSQMGEAFTRLQGRRRFELKSERGHRSVVAFGVAIERVVRMERAELNRWFMDQTSSPTLVPELGVVIVVGEDARAAAAFDALARGLGHVHGTGATRLGPADDVHGDAGQYFPDIIHLARVRRAALIDGWDPQASRDRIAALGEGIRSAAQAVSFRVGLDNNAGVLLERMAATARKVGLISLLAAIPLAWMAWVLMANIATLLLLNGRRVWGLLRLRGAPARLIAAAVIAAVGSGAIAAAVAGCILGTAAPLAWYGGRALSWASIASVADWRFVTLAAAIGVAVALGVSVRLARFALSVTPIEAAARVSAAEREHARVHFGAAAAVSLAIGALKVTQWIAAGAGMDVELPRTLRAIDRILDFFAYPFLVYGITVFVASRPARLARVLSPIARLFGGGMAAHSLRHFAARPHRAAAVVLVVALAASLALYPTVLTAVFDDKVGRAALVQLGNPLHVTLHAPDLVDASTLARGALAERYPPLRGALRSLQARLEALPEVAAAGFIAEGLVDGIYIAGQGFDSTPVYLVEPDQVGRFHRENALAADRRFDEDIARLRTGAVLPSAALDSEFEASPRGLPVGRDVSGRMARAPVGGVLYLMPGAPPAAVATRDSFSAARVDYINALFERRAYVVAAAGNANLAGVDVLIPRVAASVRPKAGVAPERLREAVLAALPARPLEVRELREETERLGSDMYVFLARGNVRIYLAGGLLMALVGMAAVAAANFADDRRTLALLRVRGARRRDVLAFLSAGLTAPALAGIALGAPIALAVGFGITHVVWQLRDLKTVLAYLPEHAAVSAQTAWIAALLCAAVAAMVVAIGRWVFRRGAVAALSER